MNLRAKNLKALIRRLKKKSFETTLEEYIGSKTNPTHRWQYRIFFYNKSSSGCYANIHSPFPFHIRHFDDTELSIKFRWIQHFILTVLKKVHHEMIRWILTEPKRNIDKSDKRAKEPQIIGKIHRRYRKQLPS